MTLLSDKQLYQITNTAAGALAGIAVHNAVEFVWERLSSDDTEDPEDPGTGDVSWQEALAFAAVSGLLVAVARVVAKRGATAGFRHALGRDPDALV